MATVRAERERFGPILEQNAALQVERRILRRAIGALACFEGGQPPLEGLLRETPSPSPEREAVRP
jgi:hypothetical protein